MKKIFFVMLLLAPASIAWSDTVRPYIEQESAVKREEFEKILKTARAVQKKSYHTGELSLRPLDEEHEPEVAKAFTHVVVAAETRIKGLQQAPKLENENIKVELQPK